MEVYKPLSSPWPFAAGFSSEGEVLVGGLLLSILSWLTYN